MLQLKSSDNSDVKIILMLFYKPLFILTLCKYELLIAWMSWTIVDDIVTFC